MKDFLQKVRTFIARSIIAQGILMLPKADGDQLIARLEHVHLEPALQPNPDWNKSE